MMARNEKKEVTFSLMSFLGMPASHEPAPLSHKAIRIKDRAADLKDGGPEGT